MSNNLVNSECKVKQQQERGNKVVHKKLPKGAKQTTQWIEVSAECIPTGYAFDEITRVTYEAEVEYPNGNSTPIVMNAQLVEVYYKGNREYRQAFYGEAGESDAVRESNDAIYKLQTRIDKVAKGSLV